MNFLMFVLMSGSFQEVDNKILCSREWVEYMLQKEDSLYYFQKEVIPWYETYISVQDSIIHEQEEILKAREEQLSLSETQLSLGKKTAFLNLLKGSLGGFLVGVVAGIGVTLWLQ